MFVTPNTEILAMSKLAAKLPWTPQGHSITLSPSPGLLNSNQSLAADFEVENIECDS